MRTADSHIALQDSWQVAFEPLLDQWPDAGVYQLWLWVSADLRVTVGKLGRFMFPAGVYVYTGRASRGLRSRVLRHVQGSRDHHWHIDYVLGHPQVRVEHVVLASSNPDLECAVNQAVGADGICVVPGFGASDCRHGCTAHLWQIRGGS